MKVQQAELVREDNSGVRFTVWIEKVSKLKEGVKVRLKGHDVDPDVWWRVAKLYELVRDSQDFHSDWRVGGLE